MDFLILVLLCLATYKLTDLISREAGPFSIFKKFRSLIGITENEVNYKEEVYGTTTTIIEKHISNQFAMMVDCTHCLSGWISLILCIIVSPLSLFLILNWLAVWGLTCLLFDWNKQ